jgi:DNA polymerase-4
VQGSGLGRVTVRFETPGSEPGRVRTFRIEDPDLEAVEPLPLVPGGAVAARDVPENAAIPAAPGPGDTAG